MKKRLLAILCCTALLSSSVLAEEPSTEGYFENTQEVMINNDGVPEEGTLEEGIYEQGQEEDDSTLLYDTDDSLIIADEEVIDTNENNDAFEDTSDDINTSDEAFFDELIEETEAEDLSNATFVVDEIEDFESVEETSIDYVHTKKDRKKYVSEDGLESLDDLKSLRSAGSFNSNYGEQLSGHSADIYAGLASYYSNNTKTGNIRIKLGTPYRYVTHGYTEENGVYTWDKANDEGYYNNQMYFRRICQGSFDAFLYDYPETFWAGTGLYSCVPTKLEYNSETGNVEAVVESVVVGFTERFLNAKTQISAYNQAVSTCVAAISDDVNNATTKAQKIKVIHDYVINNATYWYDETTSDLLYADGSSFLDALTAYNNANPDDQLNEDRQKLNFVSSPSAFFLSNGMVECEGYSRAMIILLRRFSLEGILGSGVAGGGGHAWLYCNLEGNWYLIDPTWDDGRSTLKWLYCGLSEVQNERTFASYFSNSNYQAFTQPTLAQTKYHEYENESLLCTICGFNPNECASGEHCYHVTVTTDGDGTHSSFVCSNCGDNYQVDGTSAVETAIRNGYWSWADVGSSVEYVLSVNGNEAHMEELDNSFTINSVKNPEPTCTTPGLERFSVDGFTYGNTTVEGSSIDVTLDPLPHVYSYNGYNKVGDAYVGTWKCNTCTSTQDVNGTVEETISGGSCIEDATLTRTITFVYNGETKTETETESAGKTAHNYVYQGYEKVNNKYVGTWKCSVCSDTKTVDGSVSEVTDEPTCTENGLLTRTITFTFNNETKTETETQILNKTGHAYVYQGYEKVNNKYIGTWKCSKCEDIQTIEGTVQEVTEDSTCTENGLLTRTITFTFNNETKTETEEETINLKGHNYVYQKIYKSGNDYKGQWKCSRCEDVQEVVCTVEEATVPPTCTVNGKTTRNITATFNNENKSKTEVDILNATGHNYEYQGYSKQGNTYVSTWKCKNCTDTKTVNGSVREQKNDSTCTDDGLLTRAITFTYSGVIKTEVENETIPKKGHSYGSASWTWNGNNAYATFSCGRCHTNTMRDADIEQSEVASTCKSNGYTLLTATVNFNNKTYTDEKKINYKPLSNHTIYGNPTWQWNGDKCEFYYTCGVCNQRFHGKATVTSREEKPTCAKDGKTHYTATYELNGKTYTNTKTETLYRTGKESHGEVTKKVTKSTCETVGRIEEYCSVCGKLLNTTVTPKLGHNYGNWVTERTASVFSGGLKTRTCTNCGKKETQTSPQLNASVSLNYHSLPLKTKQSTSVLKADGLQKTDHIKSWTSSNPKVATVSDSGVVRGVKKGTAIITVTTAGGATDSCTIKVQKKAVKTKKVRVTNNNNDVSTLTLKVGSKVNLKAIVEPVTSLEKVSFKSSKKKVAKVTKGGVLTAKKKGTCKITVKSGKKKKVIKVNVVG